MKRFFALALSLLIMLSLCACGGGNTTSIVQTAAVLMNERRAPKWNVQYYVPKTAQSGTYGCGYGTEIHMQNPIAGVTKMVP